MRSLWCARLSPRRGGYRRRLIGEDRFNRSSGWVNSGAGVAAEPQGAFIWERADETQHTLDRYYRRRPRFHDRLSVPSEPVLVDLRLASESSHVVAVAVFGRGSFWLHLAGVVRQKQYGLRGAAGHRPRHVRRLGCGLHRASTGADRWHGEFARLDYGRAHGLVHASLRVFPVCEATRFWGVSSNGTGFRNKPATGWVPLERSWAGIPLSGGIGSILIRQFRRPTSKRFQLTFKGDIAVPKFMG